MEAAPQQVIPELVAFKIPAHTNIEAHDHPDDRVANVISDIWNVGYGERFDVNALKALSWEGASLPTAPKDIQDALDASLVRWLSFLKAERNGTPASVMPPSLRDEGIGRRRTAPVSNERSDIGSRSLATLPGVARTRTCATSLR
jgi:hypothetical protein